MDFGFKLPFPRKFEVWGEAPDGRNWRFLEPLVYQCKAGRLVRVAPGSVTDGVSTPREVWDLIAPFDFWMCGALHDAAYHNSLEQYESREGGEGEWVRLTLTLEEANGLIDEALESRGCEFLERMMIVDALKEFGAAAFEADRRGPIVPTVTKT